MRWIEDTLAMSMGKIYNPITRWHELSAFSASKEICHLNRSVCQVSVGTENFRYLKWVFKAYYFTLINTIQLNEKIFAELTI